ncbi:MAG TPA: hypothetical protein PK395_00315 [bacterium]|nr:hypothetical protein [bacterium]HQP97511.1 hypothetical protein [bacterium]
MMNSININRNAGAACIGIFLIIQSVSYSRGDVREQNPVTLGDVLPDGLITSPTQSAIAGKIRIGMPRAEFLEALKNEATLHVKGSDVSPFRAPQEYEQNLADNATLTNILYRFDSSGALESIELFRRAKEVVDYAAEREIIVDTIARVIRKHGPPDLRFYALSFANVPDLRSSSVVLQWYSGGDLCLNLSFRPMEEATEKIRSSGLCIALYQRATAEKRNSDRRFRTVSDLRTTPWQSYLSDALQRAGVSDTKASALPPGLSSSDAGPLSHSEVENGSDARLLLRAKSLQIAQKDLMAKHNISLGTDEIRYYLEKDSRLSGITEYFQQMKTHAESIAAAAEAMLKEGLTAEQATEKYLKPWGGSLETQQLRGISSLEQVEQMRSAIPRDYEEVIEKSLESYRQIAEQSVLAELILSATEKQECAENPAMKSRLYRERLLDYAKRNLVGVHPELMDVQPDDLDFPDTGNIIENSTASVIPSIPTQSN